MDVQKYKELLKEYVSFKSISTDLEKKEDMLQTVEWLKNLFQSNGFEVKSLEVEGTNPLVFASYKLSDDAETVLVYGHYDVQPADKEDGWNSEPFELTERNGRLYARGVMDNKGQSFVHIFTVLELIKQKKLKYNVKFIIEGGEEVGDVDSLIKIITENKDLLTCDHILVSDGELVAGRPSFDSSFRGGMNLTVKFKVSDNNVHSGVYGGAVANSAFELSKLLAKIYDDNNVVTIPGFYNDVDEITEKQLKNNKRLTEIDAGKVLTNVGFKALRTENNKYDFYTQTGLRPTLQVTGLKSGYIGNGYANIVPNVAEARINFRLVASQSPQRVLELFENFVRENTPEYVQSEVVASGLHDPVKLKTDSEQFSKVRKMLEESYGSEVFDYYVGGAIPVIAKMKEIFGIDAVSVGLANDDCNMHGVDENF
ncbi:MAG TPA: M20/M25/M40 family metallo-hydrolase, partial [Candidatus Dojkabacteria bacterium]|nr:M20/M25/M40 family metallo-hydrolase [Candidatus Dojkabacteria bacterium]